MPLCTICELEDATKKCQTCQKCRAYIHRWGNAATSRVVTHFDNLRVRTRRMTTFAVVKDEEVKYVDFQHLQENKIIYMSKKELKRRGRANVISIQVAQQLRAQQLRRFA